MPLRGTASWLDTIGMSPMRRRVRGGKSRLYFNVPKGWGIWQKSEPDFAVAGWGEVGREGGPAKTLMTSYCSIRFLVPLETIVPFPSNDCSHVRHLAIVLKVAHPVLLAQRKPNR